MNLSKVVYEIFKTRIQTGVYKLGYTELEPTLAKEYGVSRTPMREALVFLEAEGYIKLVPRKGMTVISRVTSVEKGKALTHLETMEQVIIYSDASVDDQTDLLFEITLLKALLRGES